MNLMADISRSHSFTYGLHRQATFQPALHCVFVAYIQSAATFAVLLTYAAFHLAAANEHKLTTEAIALKLESIRHINMLMTTSSTRIGDSVLLGVVGLLCIELEINVEVCLHVPHQSLFEMSSH